MAVNDYLRRSYLMLKERIRDGFCDPYEASTQAELEDAVHALERDIDALGDVERDYYKALKAVGGNTTSTDQVFQDANKAYQERVSLAENHMAALSRLSAVTEGDSCLLTFQRLDSVNEFNKFNDDYSSGAAFRPAVGGAENYAQLKASLMADTFMASTDGSLGDLTKRELINWLQMELETAAQYSAGIVALHQKVQQWPVSDAQDFARFDKSLKAAHRGQLAFEASIQIFKELGGGYPDDEFVSERDECQLADMKSYMDKRNSEYAVFVQTERNQFSKLGVEAPDEDVLKGKFLSRYSVGANATLARLRADEISSESHSQPLDTISNDARIAAFMGSEGYALAGEDRAGDDEKNYAVNVDGPKHWMGM